MIYVKTYEIIQNLLGNIIQTADSFFRGHAYSLVSK